MRHLAHVNSSCISNSKSHHAFQLEYLKLYSVGGGDFGGLPSQNASSLTGIINSLSRVWLLTRSPRDDSRDKVIVREVGKRSREEYEHRGLRHMDQAAWLKLSNQHFGRFSLKEKVEAVTGMRIVIAGHC
jgi:hypothetical protein